MIRSAAAVVALSILPALAAPSTVSAQAQEEYTVSAGNTLWDLAEQFYGNPFDWRRIWEANRETIANPDLILPGQLILIPGADGSMMQVRVVDRGQEVPMTPVVPEAPRRQRTMFYPDTTSAGEQVRRDAEARYEAVPRQIAWSSPFALDRSGVVAVGEIEGFEGESNVRSGQTTAQPFDRLVLRTEGRAPVGESFISYRVEMREGVGEIAIPTSLLVITESTSGNATAMLETAFDRTTVGDHIMPLPDYRPVPGALAEEVVNGTSATIIGFLKESSIHGPGDPIFLDKGADAGIEIGDEFRVLYGSELTEGVAQVVRVGDATATARIVRMRSAVFLPGAQLQESRRMPRN